MAHLDLHHLADVDGYVLDVQADLLQSLATAVVVPLLPRAKSPPPMTRLNPVFEIDGAPYVMMTQLLSAVARKELGPRVGSLGGSRRYDVINALDFLLTGA